MAQASDLDLLAHTLEEVHPDPYAVLPRHAFRHHLDAARDAWRLASSPREAFLALAPVVAALGDGHTSVGFPTAHLEAYRRGGGGFFPWSVTFEDGAIRGTDPDDPARPVPIAAVNGRPADELLADCLRLASGRGTHRLESVRRSWPTYLWALGLEPPFEVETGDGSRRRLSGAPPTRPAIGPTATQMPYAFAIDEEGIARLDFRSMSDPEAFAELLADLFSRLRQDPGRGLIVDLRDNGGGNSSLGDALLRHVTNRAYRMAGRKEWRVSRQYQALLRKQGVTESPYLKAPVGDTIAHEAQAQAPAPCSLRYEGPVCLLIGSYTFSSAVMLADAVSTYDLATLIGSETGGVPNEFGEQYSLTLPDSGLRVDMSTARYVRASGDADDPRGVLPHVSVAAGSVDDAARAWVLAGGG